MMAKIPKNKLMLACKISVGIKIRIAAGRVSALKKVMPYEIVRIIVKERKLKPNPWIFGEAFLRARICTRKVAKDSSKW